MERAPVRSGVFVVDKAPGMTSFDVVAAVRRRLGQKRVGHAGTLDPDAAGVLPILLGEATKLMPYLVDQDKAYDVVVRLGLDTDTGDVSGRVLRTAPVPELGRATVERACRPFIGRITQVPPMYSALHHEGRRLYELAREGVEVPREPRPVVLHSIAVETVDGAQARLTIVCGKGTYVRTLVADIGRALGCGAAVEHLVRTRVGPFGRGEAVPWTEVAAATRDALWARVLPPEAALAGWPEVRLDARTMTAFLNGQPVRPPGPAVPRGLVRVHEPGGRFAGVGEAVGPGGPVRPLRILHADRAGSRVLPA